MAEASEKTLKDVVSSLKTINTTLNQPVKKSAADIEREQEAARDAKESKKIQQDILSTLQSAHGSAAAADKKQGGLIAGLLGGIGAGLGGIAKGISKITPAFVIGMGSLAGGIGAFMLALGGAGKIAELAGFDGKNLRALVENTIGAFSGTDLVFLGAVVGAAMLMSKKKVSKVGVVLGMGAIGAGIGAFILALGGAGKIAELAGFDGKQLNTLVTNIFGAFSGTDLIIMGGILAAAVGLEKSKTTKAGVIFGMGAIGAGIGTFLLALGGAGKVGELAGFDGKALNTLVTNIFGAFSGTDLVVLASILGAAVGLEKSKTTKAGVIFGMGAIGAGIGTFILTLGGAGKIGELAGFDGKALNTLVTNIFGAFSGTDLVVLASILGAAVGLEKTKTSKTGVILGMGAIGAGIGTFVLALGGAGKIGELAGFDGKALNTLVKNVFGAFEGTDLVVMGAIIAAAMGIEKAKVSKIGVVLGMGAIGAGIAAFTLGILLADGFSNLGALISLDGKSLKKLLGNFFQAFETVGVAPLVALITAGALAGAIPGGELAVVKGMTAIGAGIAGFSIGLLAAEGFAMLGKMLGLDGSALKVLLGNLGEGIGGFIGGIGAGVFKQLEDLDSDKLIDLGKGIAGIGAGIAAFGVGSILGVIGGVMEGLGSFFGVKSPIDTIIALSKDKSIDAERLAALGEGLEPLGKGIAAFAGFEMKGGFFGGDTDIESFIKVIAKIGDSKVKINADNLNNLAEGLGPFGKAMSGFSGVDIAKIVDESTFGKSTLEIFFDLLSSEKLGQMASPAEMQKVADGLTPLGKAMDTFSGLDMASIVGNNWTPGKETSFESFIGALGMATEKIKDPKHLQEVAIGIQALGEGMQSFKRIDVTTINAALQSAAKSGGIPKMAEDVKAKGAEVTETAEGVVDNRSRKAKRRDRKKLKRELEFQLSRGEITQEEYDQAKYGMSSEQRTKIVSQLKEQMGTTKAQTGGLVTTQTAGIFQLHQGEMIMDNAAVAAFQKSLDLVNKSQENALAGTGSGQPIIINNNNVDNSVQSSQTTAVSMPEPTRSNESTLRALQMN